MAIKKAVVLAAGEGRRLRPLTYTRPKCMIQLAGKPILQHVLENLKAVGVNEAAVLVKYKKETITDYCAKRGFDGVICGHIHTPEIKTMPQRKATEFLTYYSGSEPFLQNCYTPLCQKIIFNNFGISYAKDAEFPKARGMFEECLKIDSYFKPASFNLSIIDRLEGKGD